MAYRFGAHLVLPRQRELIAGGRSLPIGQRGFELLLALIEAEGRTLSRDELIERVWPGRVVADENLKVQVMALRRLIGDAAVVTVPRRGYRFAAAVETVDDAAAQAVTPVAPAPLPPPPAATSPPAHLPRSPLPLVGRDAELASLLDTLATARLVTLCGPGGVGKTRLALAAAERMAGRLADGAGWVDLAALHDPATLVPTVMRTLALASDTHGATAETLAAALRPLELLLVLDNCEHLSEAVAALASALLAGAPQVRLLATSQQPLALSQEVLVPLPGLALPAADAAADDAQALLAHGAVALFFDRVCRVQPGFEPKPALLRDIASICRRLDGLPLAIELAAARVPLLGVAGVLQRLDQPLMLLGGAGGTQSRHATLRAALTWSHDLLSHAEQRTLHRLAVFVGSFGLDAALEVAADPGEAGWELIDRLGVLVARSLLVATGGDAGPPRYRLLEGTRAFALEELAADGETGAMRRRHAEATLAIFEAAEERMAVTPMLQWVEPLLPELGNLRAALAWAERADGDSDLAFALAAASGSFWTAAGLDGDAQRVLDGALPRLTPRTPLRHQARYWLAQANRCVHPSMLAADAVAAASRALALYRELDDGAGMNRALSLLAQNGQRVDPRFDVDAVLAEMRALERPDWSPLQLRGRRWLAARQLWRRGDWPGYGAAFRDELRLMREAGDIQRAWQAAHNVALAEIKLDRPAEAVAVMAPVVAEIRAHGLSRRCWSQLAMLAMAHIATGAGATAAPAVRDALAVLRTAGSVWWLSDHFAWWLVQLGHHADGARLLGWAKRRAEQRGESPSPQTLAARAAIASARCSRPDAEVAALETAGRDLDDEAVVGILLRAAA